MSDIRRIDPGPRLSEASVFDTRIYCSGMIPEDISQDIAGQTRQALGEIDSLLAKGELVCLGRKVNPGAIKRTALLTVEGERDDICSVGQTAAAHDMCTGLRPHLKRHHLQPGVGHYGTFSGKKWEGQIYPQIRNLVLATN